MKTKNLLTAFVSSFIFHTAAFAQGILTPPGAPAPTMKSLDQIEARTAITNRSSLVTLAQPGSYYLTGNLTVSTGDGIDITTNDVTLDLNGFTIRSTAALATNTGINFSSGLSDIAIYNGHIRGGVTNNGSNVYGGSGFAYGIAYLGNHAENVLVSRVSVSGCQFAGIYLGIINSTVVEACSVKSVGNQGITASTVKNCSATDCLGIAINATQVSDSLGISFGGNGGIYAATVLNSYGYSGGISNGIDATTAQNCYGYSTGTGIGLNSTVAQNCYGYNSGGGTGLNATKTATGCYGQSITGAGLSAFIANSCSGTSFSVTHNVNSF